LQFTARVGIVLRRGNPKAEGRNPP
jgi:hypothetical protein